MQENKQETMQAELPENYLKLHVPNVAAPCKVPFQPSNDRPVYCSDCFANKR